MKHTQTNLTALRQGIEIQSVETDYFGRLIHGPHELWGKINGVNLSIAIVPSQKSIHTDARPDGEVEPTYTITSDEAIANLRRLAHCWNCHDQLVNAMSTIIGDIDAKLGIRRSSIRMMRAALKNARGE